LIAQIKAKPPSTAVPTVIASALSKVGATIAAETLEEKAVTVTRQERVFV